jgi:hypothetical protein
MAVAAAPNPPSGAWFCDWCNAAAVAQIVWTEPDRGYEREEIICRPCFARRIITIRRYAERHEVNFLADVAWA